MQLQLQAYASVDRSLTHRSAKAGSTYSLPAAFFVLRVNYDDAALPASWSCLTQNIGFIKIEI